MKSLPGPRLGLFCLPAMKAIVSPGFSIGASMARRSTSPTSASLRRSPSGSRVVKFTYHRDDFISTDESDGAFLDQFRFIPATNAPPKFQFPAYTENGFSALITHDPSRSYRIQRSTNLTSWIDLTNFNTTENLYDFLDPEATNNVRRFYRVVTP